MQACPAAEGATARKRSGTPDCDARKKLESGSRDGPADGVNLSGTKTAGRQGREVRNDWCRMSETPLAKTTSLHSRHVALGGKMVEFAGYEMPVQYGLGVLNEHLHTRAHAGLFDVSHMGQAIIESDDKDYSIAARALEAFVPADILGMEPGQQRYTQLLNGDGGTIDDLMVSRMRLEGHTHQLYLVVNAGCKAKDFAHLEANLPDGVSLRVMDDRFSLIALQGPEAADVLGQMNPAVRELVFMTHGDYELDLRETTIHAHVSRSGYTGEDGYEISATHDDMALLVDALLEHDAVEPIGLGARDSLRLEAGLCLYGHELDESISPIEASLNWSIPKRRREEGGFPGAERIRRELKDKPARKLVAILPEGRAPAREGVEIVNSAGRVVGRVTSGGFGPTVGGPVAIGMVERAYSKPGSELTLMVRGKPRPARAVKLPFVPHNYHRG